MPPLADPTIPPGPAPPPHDRVAHSAGLTGAATLASRVLGLARDQVLAAIFGAGNEMDAFIVAFRIPNLVRDLFAEGAMSSAFVPTFATELEQKGKPAAWKLGNNLLNALLAATGLLVVAGLVLTRPAVNVYAREYADVPGKVDLTVQMAQLMLPFLTLTALSAATMGMLNSLHYYFVPALAPAMFNVVTIVCALGLVPLMPAFGLPRIMAIAIAALIGGAGQLALQWPALRREGFRYRLGLDIRDPSLLRVLLLMGPGTVGLAATQVNLLINTLLATSQGTGAVSWLQYAFRLIYLPIGLFGVSIATATLPSVARYAAAGDREALRRTVVNSMNLMLVVNVPAAVGLFVLADDIVRLLFERGQFSAVDTANTASALRCYAVGLVGYSTARIASPLFYALGRSRVPVELSALAIVVNIAVGVILVRVLGFSGLALATSIAAIVNGGLALAFLRDLLGGIDGGQLASKLARIAAASLAMAIVIVLVEWVMSAVVPRPSPLIQAVRLTAAFTSALLTLALLARRLGLSEFDTALAAVRERVQKAWAN